MSWNTSDNDHVGFHFHYFTAPDTDNRLFGFPYYEIKLLVLILLSLSDVKGSSKLKSTSVSKNAYGTVNS